MGLREFLDEAPRESRLPATAPVERAAIYKTVDPHGCSAWYRTPGGSYSESMNTMTATRNGDATAPASPAVGDDELARARFVEAMAAAPTAVTVVVHSDGERITGQTVSALSSVTADPPMLLVCINTRSPLQRRLAVGQEFSVNVLAPEQTEIANSFAGRGSDDLSAYAVEKVDWIASDFGVPTIAGATSSFVCRVESHLLRATHGIVIARVLSSSHEAAAPHGLAYCQRAYRTLS